MTAITCSPDSNIMIRFINHARLGLNREVQEHHSNLIEKMGNLGLWPLENLPRITRDVITDPRVVTLMMTASAMLADSYCFYPEDTSAFVKAAWALLPTIPFWAVKFAGYVSSIEVIGSYGMRAEGRFTNRELMDRFYRTDADPDSSPEETHD